MMNTSIRPAAVAGLFYPGSAHMLQLQIGELLAGAMSVEARPTLPRVIVAPHAGYIYSGPVAANAYAAIARLRRVVTRVLLLGPTHRVPVQGFAYPAAHAFATPLGNVRVSQADRLVLQRRDDVRVDDRPHGPEHSLEVHLPFLQTVLDDFELVPVLVGDARPDAVAELLESLWGGPETLVVISSDLSHYRPYRQAQVCDRETVDQIMQLRGELSGEQACGAHPLNGLMRVAALRGLDPQLLDLRNSGDTAGDRERVVGYASIVFTESGQHERALRH